MQTPSLPPGLTSVPLPLADFPQNQTGSPCRTFVGKSFREGESAQERRGPAKEAAPSKPPSISRMWILGLDAAARVCSSSSMAQCIHSGRYRVARPVEVFFLEQTGESFFFLSLMPSLHTQDMTPPSLLLLHLGKHARRLPHPLPYQHCRSCNSPALCATAAAHHRPVRRND